MKLGSFTIGMTLLAAVSAVAVGVETGSVWLGLGMFVAACVVAQLFALLVMTGTAHLDEIRGVVRRGMIQPPSARDDARR